MQYQGTLISFEGIEGCGKTTQIQMLSQALTQRGHNVTCLREPGGTKFGEKLREAILASDEKIAATAEAMLFASSRAQLIEQIILPKLANKNDIVILDRFIDSSFVYQGIARGLGVDQIETIHSVGPLTIRPNITFYLHIDFEKSQERQRLRNSTKDYFERESESFYQNLINGFNKLVTLYPQRIQQIDGSLGLNQIHQTLMNIINTKMK